jgi:MFS family permease
MNRLQHLASRYPRQFWLMFFGMLLSTVGASMLWPFLMLYVSEKLEIPLATAGGLTTLNAAVGILSSFFVGGPITDRVGRKGVMVVSLITNGLAYLVMSRADSLPAFAILMSITGAVNPLYRVGGDAMVADLVPPDQRADAYALLRLSNNVGVAIGPAVGGMLIAASYSIAFYCAGALFYAAGVGSVSLARGFWGFWLSMVIMTIGELIAMPTSSTYAAGLAPADMRGRYMSILASPGRWLWALRP